MIPFQLHRRIPLLRRPFFQRDQAIVERDNAKAESYERQIELDLARAMLRQTEAERLRLEQIVHRFVPEAITALPRPPHPATGEARRRPIAPFQLPAHYTSVSITGHQGQLFEVVVGAENPGEYDQWLIQHRPYSEIARLLIKLLGGKGTLIDLGANVGTISLPVASSGSRVIAVEMLPVNVQKLMLGVALNNLAYVRVVGAAVSDRDGLVSYAGSDAWAQVATEATEAQAVGLRLPTIINQIELDSPWFLQPPLAIKIDVEGHELPVLLGTDLTRMRPPIVFESIALEHKQPDRAFEVKKLLVDRGFELYLLRNSVLAPHFPGDPQISAVSDILALPHEQRDEVLASLAPDYVVRHLTSEEQLDWMKEVGAHPMLAEHLSAVVSRIFITPSNPSAI